MIIFAAGIYVFTSDSKGKLTNNETSQPMRKAESVDMENIPGTWKKAETFEEVNQFFEDKIPGLSLARKEGLTTLPQQSAVLPKRNGRMQINEVWHSGQTIHLFYSLDLSALMDGENSPVYNLPTLEAVHIDKTEDTTEETFQTHSNHIYSKEIILFENRLYGVIQTPGITENWDYQQTMLDKDYDQTIPTSLDLRIDGSTIRSEAMPIRYFHDKEAHSVQTYTSEDVYSNNGLVIEPLEVELKVNVSRIKMKIKGEGVTFNETIEAHLETKDGREIPIARIYNEKEDQVYEGWFQPVKEVPEDISLVIDSVHLREDRPYSFNVDLTQFETFTNASDIMDKKVGEAHETDIMLNRIDLHNSEHMSLQLNYNPHEYEQKEKLIGAPFNAYNYSQEHEIKGVSIESNDGLTAKGELYGHDNRSDINFHAKKFKNSSTLKVTVNKMVFSRDLNQRFELN
ncbi:hypothetical protein [Halobacillus litoralis]|uniref:hypothetical protein n=1 Tax=Halobacillus litoralis TaxID=45668 RepID=UPI001CFE6661|nr:hypothetical protein [Halobacillus litoralis]